ncbi:hypothetical protein [Enterococcus hulanensis]|uniref:hypothetical protein n=1 Tax=Enterococcus hulanensis TaxID=2559929 RepID=UPI002016FE1B|nr:hypothetical protein [Enterococcus hulanensis]
MVRKIKEEFLTYDFKNLVWENEVGYSMEEFMDDYFADILPEIMTLYVSDIVDEQVASSEKLRGSDR